jgi:hypothetical protein
MNNSEIKNDWIDRYNENALNPYELKRFNEKLNRNPVLRAEVSVDRCLNEILSDQDALDFYQKIGRARQRQKRHIKAPPLLLLAASIILLIVATGLLLRLTKVFSVEKQTHPPVAGMKKMNEGTRFLIQPNSYGRYNGNVTPAGRRYAILNPQVASKFNSLRELEILVGGTTRNPAFILTSPIVRQRLLLGSPVKFNWESSGNAIPIVISILDNQGNCIYQSTAILGNSFLLDTADFMKGLYYWRITVEDELVLVGKMALY